MILVLDPLKEAVKSFRIAATSLEKTISGLDIMNNSWVRKIHPRVMKPKSLRLQTQIMVVVFQATESSQDQRPAHAAGSSLPGPARLP